MSPIFCAKAAAGRPSSLHRRRTLHGVAAGSAARSNMLRDRPGPCRANTLGELRVFMPSIGRPRCVSRTLRHDRGGAVSGVPDRARRKRPSASSEPSRPFAVSVRRARGGGIVRCRIAESSAFAVHDVRLKWQRPCPQKVVAAAAAHGAPDRRQSLDLAFDLSVAPVFSRCVLHAAQVVDQRASTVLHRSRARHSDTLSCRCLCDTDKLRASKL